MFRAIADQAEEPCGPEGLPPALPARWARLADRIRLEWQASWFPDRHLVIRTSWLSRRVLATMAIVPVLEPVKGKVFERISVAARSVFPNAHAPADRLDLSFCRELDNVAALHEAEAELKMRYVRLLADRESRGEAWEHLVEAATLADPA
ncbi:hypothetical protein ORIO_20450 (plasmid) [Cereibacter azotoformans]|uniref:hypothetical protein n=1 Tax=Cereibacter azotoformans TaxID=43057 RepID=UPI0015F30CCF|nr:hypothetical protein [Cereibacter azotoformans]UIJ32914.1 hypothetical protein LV780_20265 [Cereibacter azotoformans]ULB12174.1 hypothetical protein ORIO_20450 [Cereibacter azotoformans]